VNGLPAPASRRFRGNARVAAVAVGFTVATIRTALIAHPVLRVAASGVTISGYVELREESQHTDRFVLRVEHIEGGRLDDKPQRVRLSVKRGMAPAPGSFVEVKALIDPPLQPLKPGSYDFAHRPRALDFRLAPELLPFASRISEQKRA
jgi:competence protein ComEC